MIFRQMKIGELFDEISEIEQHEFKLNEMYEPKTKMATTDNNGFDVDITWMIVKEDEILKFTLDDGHELKVAKKHIFNIDGRNVVAANLAVGDYLEKVSTDKVFIESIENSGTDKVYDIGVASGDMLYSDTYGIIHHNTFSVTKHLEDFGKHKNEEYIVFKGTASPMGLYRALYLHRHQIVIFDDCDSILKDSDASNILKAALDSYDVREISWISKSTFDPKDMSPEEIEEMIVKEGKYPQKFEFRGQIIFISNIHKSKIEQAVISRSMTIDITLEAQDVFKRMETILGGIDKDTPMTVKKEVIDYLKEEYKDGGGKQANMRTLLAALKCRNSGSPNWKRLVASYC